MALLQIRVLLDPRRRLLLIPLKLLHVSLFPSYVVTTLWTIRCVGAAR